MSFSEVLDIKNWFKGQHITLSTDWIQACVEFVKQEQQGLNLSTQQLKNCIYEQWLVADLEELSVPALPLELHSTQKVTLNGAFALQVNGIRDISKPAYSQLKEMEGITNSNVEVSATPRAALPEWESKPTRMLLLNLTDGCTHIQGMEYMKIPFLSPNLPPGVKVLIKGPVDCRFGVLMLTKEKLQLLGGEVEINLGRFSREAILRDMLQLPTVQDSTSDTVQLNISIDASSTTRTTVQNISNLPVPTNNHSASNRILHQPDSRSRETGNTRSICNQAGSDNKRNVAPVFYQNSNQRNANRKSVGTRFNDLDQFDDDDDFVQNLDYSTLDEIERNNSQKQAEVDEVFEDWAEDEDVMQELMAFQEMEPEVLLPFEAVKSTVYQSTVKKTKCVETDVPFTYLSSVSKQCTSRTITIKGFIITVLSKLSCTEDEGWQLTVKINDGTDSIDVDIHNLVLEQLIGISAANVIATQGQSCENTEALKKIKEAVSNCKVKLQNLNCLMDIKFSPDIKPCLVKCSTIEKTHLKQLLDRVKTDDQCKPEVFLIS